MPGARHRSSERSLSGHKAGWRRPARPAKALAQERRRFGYRRLHLMLRREGHAVDRKRVQRIYREEGPTPPTPAQINHGHSLWLDEKQGGARQRIFRRIATRYDKRVGNFLSAVLLAAAAIWWAPIESGA